MAVVLCVGMLVTVLWVIVSGVPEFQCEAGIRFSARRVYVFHRILGRLRLRHADRHVHLLGYYDICYVGGEVRNPERVIPRSIIYSVIGIASIYCSPR